jgi:putative membrane protein insertion efficiency factor
MKHIVISLITLYRWLISPFLPPSCRFTPTCSRYAISAIECHGLTKGLWMTAKRILRCHPFSKQNENNFDPVPQPSFLSSTSLVPKTPANTTNSTQVKRAQQA